MKIYGYEAGKDELIALSEVSIKASISELESLIEFLSEVKEQHEKVESESDLVHSHLRDWAKEWNDEEPDIIIVS